MLESEILILTGINIILIIYFILEPLLMWEEVEEE